MIINSVKLTGFRNFQAMETNFSAGVNIFYGNNGSGKTNLLEAIFVLCLGRSYRSAVDTVLLNDQSEVYRIEGLVNSNDRLIELAVAYQRGGRKKITLDKLVIRIAELYDNFCAVAASPEDSEILAGSPSVRRQFLDIYLSQYSQKYLHTLSDYQKILAQKNAALKSRMDPAPYNEMMVNTGSQLMLARFEFINKISRIASLRYEAIADGSPFVMKYKPSIDFANDEVNLDQIKSSFEATLYDYRAKEEIMERSLVGPHRDDISFDISGFPARSHGSQGEWRTAALSLKLAVYELLKEKREVAPILLLDEIFAELDKDRCEGLIRSFSDFNQLFLTTAVEPPEFLKENSRNFNIVNGQLTEVN